MYAVAQVGMNAFAEFPVKEADNVLLLVYCPGKPTWQAHLALLAQR